MDPSPDRARRHTALSVLRRIDDVTVAHLAEVARRPDMAPTRMAALDREWDLDRLLETEAATMGLLGLTLGVTVNPRFLAVPGVVGAAVCLFALQGLYPLLPLFRRLGVRTSREIERERYAIKALRGDFASLPDAATDAATPAATPSGGSPPTTGTSGGLH